MQLARKVRVLRDVGEDLWPLRPHDLAVEVGLVVQVEAHSDQAPQIVEAAPADDHQAVSLDHLDGAAVVGHDSLQLAEDRLEGVLEAQRLAEHLRDGQERLGALSCALELGDVVVDRVEADVLTLDPERHEHHLDVDRLPVLPDATGDPVGTTFLERLVGDVLAFFAEVLVEDEVVDQTPDRLLRGAAEELRRRRVPARHPLIGVHHDDCDRAHLDEQLEVLLLAADSAFRCRVSSIARARERAAPMCRPTCGTRPACPAPCSRTPACRTGSTSAPTVCPSDMSGHVRASPRSSRPTARSRRRQSAPLAASSEASAVRPFGARTRCCPSPPGCRSRPTCRAVGPIDVHLVVPVGPVDQLPFLVVESNEEVPRVHELADDGVHGPVELLHVFCRARELRDAGRAQPAPSPRGGARRSATSSSASRRRASASSEERSAPDVTATRSRRPQLHDAAHAHATSRLRSGRRSCR